MLEAEMKADSTSKHEVSSDVETAMYGEGTMEELGYQDSYKRVFKALGNIALVLAMASPLSGILVTSSYSIIYGGYWGLTWGWIVPAFVFFPQALAIAELASSMPVNGAFYWWTAALAPRQISRPLSFMFGWFNLLASFTSMASFSWALATTYAAVIPILEPQWTPSNAQVLGISLAFLTFWALTTLLGMKNVGICYLISAAIVLILTIVFVVALPVTQAQQGVPFATGSQVLGEYKNFTDWGAEVAVPMSWFCAAWTVTGWSTPAYLAEGTKDAAKNTPRAIVYSYAASAGLGLVISIVYAFCINDIEAAAFDETGFPGYSLLIARWGERLGCGFIMAGICTIALGGSSLILGISSQVAAFARDGGIPRSSLFSIVHQGTNMPLHAIALVWAGSAVILLIGLSSQASTIIYSLAVIALYATYAVPIVCRIFAPRRFVPGPFSLGIWSYPTHTWAVLSIVYLSVMISFPASSAWTAESFNFNWVLALGLFCLCIVIWFSYGRKHYMGPNLETAEARFHHARDITE